MKGFDLTHAIKNYKSLLGSEKKNELLLLLSLITSGNKDMAEYFINNSSPLLQEAGNNWARDHGYQLQIRFQNR